MRICMITTMTPTSENIRGTSALPYHLLAGRDKDVTVEIFTFNNNGILDDKIRQVEEELGVAIHVVPLPKWFKFVFKFHLLFVRLFLKYPIHHYIKLPQETVDEIVALKPDAVWIYGAEWSRVTRQFEGFKRIHTMPDSEALYYYRMLGQRFVTHDWKRFWRCALMYPKFLALERNYPNDKTVYYHLVGEEDANFLKKMNPGIQARFIRHPHYKVAERKIPIKFHQSKIRLLIAGRYDLYMQQSADEVIEAIGNKSLAESPKPPKAPTDCTDNADDLTPQSPMSYVFPPSEGLDLRDFYAITLLGKGWEKHVETLSRAGYDVKHIAFAPDYVEEVCKHDIQLTPICIGTGTKGKVLDALANGLLVLGTPYALENIAVEHGISCIQWNHASEVPEILFDIAKNREKYEQIATAGREAVLKEHNPAKIAKELFCI